MAGGREGRGSGVGVMDKEGWGGSVTGRDGLEEREERGEGARWVSRCLDESIIEER